MHAAHADGFVVGLSGGIDSAVVTGLCAMAAPGAVLGVLMPCHSHAEDEAHGRLVADHFGIAVTRVDLAPPFDALTSTLQAALPGQAPADETRLKMGAANVKPRLRMTTLYFLANALNYLVVGTGNRSELTIGYFTKYGDGGVDVLPIGGLLKREVRALARDLDVPAVIIDKPPSAGLWEGQTDEQEMGFSYADLEAYLLRGPDAIAPALALRIERLMRASEHKRALPLMPGEGGGSREL
jgi:NAD+ synthase